MFLPHKPYPGAEPARWLWIVPIALATVGIMIGLHTGNFHLVNRSAAVLLLAIALACVRDIAA